MKKLTILEWVWIVFGFFAIVALTFQICFVLNANNWNYIYYYVMPFTLAIACFGWFAMWKNKYKYELALFVLIGLVSAILLVFQVFLTSLLCTFSLKLSDRIIPPITLFCFAIWYALFWILRVRKIKENENE